MTESNLETIVGSFANLEMFWTSSTMTVVEEEDVTEISPGLMSLASTSLVVTVVPMSIDLSPGRLSFLEALTHLSRIVKSFVS